MDRNKALTVPEFRAAHERALHANTEPVAEYVTKVLTNDGDVLNVTGVFFEPGAHGREDGTRVGVCWIKAE